MTTSLQVAASRGRSETWKWWKIFESRPHKAVSFVAERDNKFQAWPEHKMPEAPPGFSGGMSPGRSKGEEGRKEEDEEEENQER